MRDAGSAMSGVAVRLKRDKAGVAPTRLVWLHALCVAAAVGTLLPVAVGALVTTDKAGMAFPDWPTSDGHGMLSYPWLRAAGGKFIEHSHRLAGVVVGMMAIMVAAAAWMWEERRWVRALGLTLLAAVVAQGVLGGLRVRLNDQAIAMLHAVFVNVVMSVSVLMALATSAWWRGGGPAAESLGMSPSERWRVLLLAGVVGLQYGLGSVLRHFGTMLHEHVAMGVLVLIGSLAVAWSCVSRDRPAWLRRFGWVLGFVVVGQVALGGAAYLSRFGFPPLGWVAVVGSSASRVFPTAHTCGGVIFVATVINLAVCVCIAQRGEVGAVMAATEGNWESVGEAGKGAS